MDAGKIPMTISSVLNHLSWGVNALDRLFVRVCVCEYNTDHMDQNILYYNKKYSYKIVEVIYKIMIH